MPVVIHCKLGFHLGVNVLKNIQMLKTKEKITLEHKCGTSTIMIVVFVALLTFTLVLLG